MSLAEVIPQYGDDSTRGLDRTPPQDMTAEQCVLGAMMLSKDAIADVIEALRGTDFYRPTHEQIYDAIIDLYGRGEPADAVTVSAELGKRGELLRIGGAPYLHDLLSSVPLAANAGFYADIVREKSILRRLADASVRIAQMSYAGEGEVNDIVDRAQAEVYAVTDRRAAEDYKPLSELMQPTLDEMEAISSRDGSFAGVPTGFAEFDELTNGLHPGQMIIVAARPGMGKALALDTPLPTPTGWMTMSEVAVGDQLLGRDGRPTAVVAATEVLDDRPCFEVTFSDGSSVVADAEHQWRATSRAARRAAAQRKPARYYFDPSIIARVAALADATTGYDETYVTMAELVFEVGADLRHVLHSVGREIGPAVEVLAVAVGETTRRRVVYPRAQMLRVLAHRIGQPMSSGGAATHAEVVTTAEMLASVRLGDERGNWAVDLAEPLQLPDADLLVDPYTLGAWLGDGHSAAARVTTADPRCCIGCRPPAIAHDQWPRCRTRSRWPPAVCAKPRSRRIVGVRHAGTRVCRCNRICARSVFSTTSTFPPTICGEVSVSGASCSPASSTPTARSGSAGTCSTSLPRAGWRRESASSSPASATDPPCMRRW